MHCPKCGTPLTSRAFATIEVDQCGSCRGIWFDLGELKSILDQKDRFELKPADTPASAVYDALTGPCPRCGGQGHMTRVTSLVRPDITMDSCAVCFGIWLDGGELADLASDTFSVSTRRLFRDIFGIG